jgi:hypothetical protein
MKEADCNTIMRMTEEIQQYAVVAERSQQQLRKAQAELANELARQMREASK